MTKQPPKIIQRGAAVFVVAALLGLTVPRAHAGEIFGGVYAHDVNIVTQSGIESGVDLQLGWRGERRDGLDFIGRPSPYIFGQINSAGDTSFAAAGLSWMFGNRFYFRPGIGLAIHNGPNDFDPSGRRIYLGSRVLFEPEIGVGMKIGDRASAEISWVHLSHAQLAGQQNPGLDTVGLRVNYRMR